MSLPALTRSSLQRWGWAVSFVGLSALGFLPLFGGPSYEFGLVVGLSVPSILAVLVALEVLRYGPLPEAAVRRGLLAGTAQAALLLAIATLHGARSGFCGYWEEVQLFALGPLFGVLCGGVWGAVSGLVGGYAGTGRRARWTAIVLALCLPWAYVAIGLLRYYTSPIIFAFDPFVGYFAGTLYDTVIDGTTRLLTYRVGTVGLLLFGFALASLVRRKPDGTLTISARGRPGTWFLGGTGALLSVLIAVNGSRLGHVQTTQSIREKLGHVAESKRCEVIYASGILQRDAHALARECDEHVRQLEQYFETQVEQRIAVYLFASARQKARWMGARDVYIAKPWRHEVYLQHQGYPHPVLGHELAHVVAGTFARGPFRVAGPLGGWVPDPGRIEGFAEAAAPREQADLSVMEWAKAMRDLELLPPLSRVFRLSFFGENASKAYTVAGAFVSWLRQEHGVSAIKQWYGGQSLEVATGHSLAELERRFVADLDAIQIPSRVMATARARFDRPAVFGRSCPHQVDQLKEQAARALRQLDPGTARDVYLSILELDPLDFAARLGLGHCAFRQAKLKEAAEQYARVATDEALTPLFRARARQYLADTELLAGHVERARELYAEAQQVMVDEDELRNLDVRLLIRPGMAEEHPARRAITALLLGDPVLGTDWAVAGAELGRWSEIDTKLGYADYLLGKNYFQRGRWTQAAETLDRALERDLPLARVKREALRTRLFVACALGQERRAQAVLGELLSDRELGTARKTGVLRFASRCHLDVK